MTDPKHGENGGGPEDHSPTIRPTRATAETLPEVSAKWNEFARTHVDLRDALPPGVMAMVPPAMRETLTDVVKHYRGPFDPPPAAKPAAAPSGFDRAFGAPAAGSAEATLIPEQAAQAVTAALAAARAAEAPKPRASGPTDVGEMLARMRNSFGQLGAMEDMPAALKKL